MHVPARLNADARAAHHLSVSDNVLTGPDGRKSDLVARRNGILNR
jgi:hypothetical protein